MRRFAVILYKFRFIFLGLIAVVTFIFFSFIRVEMDNTLKAWFSKQDPAYIFFENFRKTFEIDDFLVIVVNSKDVFSPSTLNYIRQKTEELRDLPYAVRVNSLANANKIVGTTEGIEIDPLFSDLSDSEVSDLKKIKSIKEYVFKDELFRNYLISNDGQFTPIIVTFEKIPPLQIPKVIYQAREIINKEKPEDVKVYFSGDVKGFYEYDKFSKENQEIFPLISIFVIFTIVIILFRSFPRTFIILLVAGLSLCWALGFYSALGYKFNAVTSMIIPVVLILSISNGIHIIKYFDGVGGSKEEAFIRTVEYITIPCFVTSITTAFGLFSLVTSRIEGVKTFGIGSAAGVMFAFLIAIITVPTLMTLLPSCKVRVEKMQGWEYILSKIAKLNEKGFKYILVGSLLGTFLFGLGINRIKVETNEIEFFPKESEFYRATMLANKHLFGIGNMEIVLEGKEDILKEPEILKRMDSLMLKIRKLPHVTKVISLTDYVKRINKVLKEDDPKEYRIPERRDLIAQLLFLFTFSDEGRDEIIGMATPDYSQGRISIYIKLIPAEEMVTLGNTIKKMAEQEFYGTGIKTTLTGELYLLSLINKYLLEDLIKGFSLAFLLVFGTLFILFWSVKYGLLSIIPNILPIILIFGFMGWVGITLNVGTVMIASVALGIAVDDTVHFITRFRKELADNRSTVQNALRETTISTGKAMVFTTLINIFGFSVGLLSSFVPTREFSVLLALTLFFALIGDILLLPSIMMTLKKFFSAQGIREVREK